MSHNTPRNLKQAADNAARGLAPAESRADETGWTQAMFSQPLQKAIDMCDAAEACCAQSGSYLQRSVDAARGVAREALNEAADYDEPSQARNRLFDVIAIITAVHALANAEEEKLVASVLDVAICQLDVAADGIEAAEMGGEISRAPRDEEKHHGR